MNPNAIEGPRLDAADITGGAQQRNDVAVLTERHDVPLRYRLHLDNRIEQSYFVIEAYDPAARGWNELWAIPQATYTFDGAGDMDIEPRTPVLTSPYSGDQYRKAISWQKIMDALTGHADYILSARAPVGGCARCADTSGAPTGNDNTAGPITGTATK